MTVLASAGVAQPQFDELLKIHLPADNDVTTTMALGDVDGDGAADLVIANNGQNRLYLNDGQGQFTDATSTRLPTSNDNTQSVALGDVDGDGDLDVVFGNYWPTQQNRLYRNDGNGTFTDVTAARMPLNSDDTLAVALGDVDGDGDPDLVFGNRGISGEQNRLYLNDGQGQFTDVTASRMPTRNDRTVAMALGDVDGDGDPDLVIGNDGANNRLYLNEGNGQFTDATAGRMPTDDDSTQGVALGDVDVDGDLDLVIGNGGNLSQQNRLYLNDGQGRFTDATAARMPSISDSTQGLVLGDVDGDGDPEVVFLNYGQQNRLYLNDSGQFTDATATHMPTDFSLAQGVALGDVDGDADPDLALANYGQQNRLYLNDGQGRFTDATAMRMPAYNDYNLAVVLGDVDGDGDPDLVFANGGTYLQQSRLYLNDGQGQFTDVTATHMPLNKHQTEAVALGDVDGDGDPDLVLGNRASPGNTRGQTRLYLNDGSGQFTDATAARMPIDNHYTAAAVLGDVDGDSDLDLVLGNRQVKNRLYLNDGRGFFTDATAAQIPIQIYDDTLAVVLGDMDGDGDADLIFGNRSQNNRLYLNDGNGTFTDATAAHMPTELDFTYALAAGDVDGDGDLDLVCGNHTNGQNRLYLNDGQGHFADATAARLPVKRDSTFAVALGDLDLDGDLDLVVGNGASSGRQNRLYLNDGRGQFTDATAARLSPHKYKTQAVVIGDIDGDGDPDLLCGNYGEQNRLYLNLLRQLDAPFAARLGFTYRFDAYARHGYPSSQDIAGLFLATATARIPLPPWGTFGLDPSQMVALPPLVISQPAGVNSLSFVMPSVPSLAGASVHAQALLVRLPAAHLTSVTSDVIAQ